MHEGFKNHFLINGLSIGVGGGYSVGRQLWRHMATERPDCLFTLVLISGDTLHCQLGVESMPANCRIHWAPNKVSLRSARFRYEQTELAAWAHQNDVNAVVQLNGMVIPGLGVPTLSHFQDPWPYRPVAWETWRDPAIALLKRRQHVKALREADYTGWTSAYLRDLICGRLRIKPRRSQILYNGVPSQWIDRATNALPPLHGRRLQIVSVSNVRPHKRQELVIRALPILLRRPGLESLVYRIAGDCSDDYRGKLTRLAKDLGVDPRVIFEGRVCDERVTQLLGESRCFVLMSVCESFGIPAVEAMTFGTPIVTSDCCAMPEICQDAAELCPVDNVEILADKITRVLIDDAHAEDLRRKAAKRVQQFSWTATARSMAGILDQLANQ